MSREKPIKSIPATGRERGQQDAGQQADAERESGGLVRLRLNTFPYVVELAFGPVLRLSATSTRPLFSLRCTSPCCTRRGATGRPQMFLDLGCIARAVTVRRCVHMPSSLKSLCVEWQTNAAGGRGFPRYISSCQAKPSRLMSALEAAGPQLPATYDFMRSSCCAQPSRMGSIP